jgi:hypothetical protein
MSKGCDFEIVSTPKTYPKVVLWKFEIELCMVLDLQV